MKRTVILTIFLAFLFTVDGFSDSSDIDFEIIAVDEGYGFFIIKGGANKKVEEGDAVFVYSSGAKIAEGHVTMVRSEVSAVQLDDVEGSVHLRKGDRALIVKEPGPKKELDALPLREEPPDDAVKRPRWAPLMKRRDAAVAEEDNGEKIALSSKWTPLIKSEKGSASKTSSYAGVRVGLETAGAGDIITVDIKSDISSVFFYSGIVLREEGFSIISSDRSKGALSAVKPVSLSLAKELWADAVAAIDHKIVILLEIEEEGNGAVLKLSGFKEYFQKNRHVKANIVRDASYYKELVEIAAAIKQLSE